MASAAGQLDQLDEASKVAALNDTRNPDLVQKYKVAAEIANETLKVVVAATAPGKVIAELCELGDQTILAKTAKVYNKGNVEKGMGFPTCLSVNHCAGHFSPLADVADALAEGDLVKIDLGVHVDGYLAVVAETVVVRANPEQPITGRAADVLMASYTGAEIALRLMKAGKTNTEVTQALAKVAAAFDVRLLEGVLSHQLQRYVLTGPKVIAGRADAENAVDEHTFTEGDVYGLDVIMSTGEGHTREQDTRTTVYKRNVDATYSLKLKASRTLFSEIGKRFPTLPFPLRAVDAERRGRLGITECVSHGLVDGFPVLYEKQGEYVAQFKGTVLLLAGGTQRITQSSPPTHVQSSFAITDPELLALLSTSAAPKKAKKNKKKSGASSSSASAQDKDDKDDDDESDAAPKATDAAPKATDAAPKAADGATQTTST